MRMIVAILLFAVGASPSRADNGAPLPSQLTLADALSIFHARGFDLLIADANAAAAEGDVVAADALPNPALSVSYGPYAFYYRCTNPAGCSRPPSSLSVEVTDQAAISDVLSGKRRLRGEVARAALRAAKLSRTDAERSLVFQVKSAFEELVLAQRALAFARDTAAANAVMLDKAEKQRDADKIQRPDLLRVRVANLESDQAVDQAVQAVQKARADLAFLLGVRTAIPEVVAVAPELEHSAPAPQLDSSTHEALLALAFATRPDLQAQQAQLASARAAVALARRQRIPDVTLSVGYTQQGTTDQASSPPTFSFGLSAPIPLLYQQQGEIARAEATLRIQQLATVKMQATVASELEIAYADYVAARALVRRMEQGELLDTARQARDDVKLLYEKGSAQLTDYLLALSTYISTNVEYLDDVAAYWNAVFELEHAVGKELR